MSRAGIEIVVAGTGEYLDEAGRLWAEATAARDGDPVIAPLEVARPIIESVLSSAGSLLLVALDDDGSVVGFAAAEPVAGEEPRRAELRYLGVRPAAWGAGVGVQLLRALHEQLVQRGFRQAQLYVYPDNRRAVALYARLGWIPMRDVRTHPRSRRPEQRYLLDLAP